MNLLRRLVAACCDGVARVMRNDDVAVAPYEEARSGPYISGPPGPPGPAGIGVSAEEIAAVVDARLRFHLDNAPAPSAPDLDGMFAGGWRDASEVNDERRAAQTNNGVTYRPDGDYPEGEERSTMPWVSPV